MYPGITKTIENIPALNRADAARLADQIVDELIAALQRNPAISQRSFIEWAVALADVRVRTIELIHRRVGGCVDIDDVVHALEIEDFVS